MFKSAATPRRRGHAGRGSSSAPTVSRSPRGQVTTRTRWYANAASGSSSRDKRSPRSTDDTGVLHMKYAAKIRSIAGSLVLLCAPCTFAADLVPKAPPDAMKLTALDYAEIQQLAVKYAWLLDKCANGGYDYADLYVADGQFSVAEEFGAPPDKHRFTTKGREALAKAAGGDGKGGCADPK